MKKNVLGCFSLSGGCPICLMETWQSWFNAPDLKSDEGASPPGVRIPASPPIELTVKWAFFYVIRTPGEGFDYKRKAGGRTPVSRRLMSAVRRA